MKSLKSTDPELYKIFNDFVFEEVKKYVDLDEKTKIIVTISSCIAQNTTTIYKEILKDSLNTKITPIEVKEILYQAVPYCGISKVIDFINITNEILQSKGITLPLENKATVTNKTRHEKGIKIQKEIFGEVIDNMYKQSPKDQIYIQEFLSSNCFGDYYTREGLNSKTRELITFSILASQGGCESQLKGHIQGNIAVGNGKKILLSTITQLLPYIGYPRTLNAIRCINEICN